MWITNGSCADFAIVWAKTDDDIIKLTDKGKLLSNELFREILYPSGK